MKISLKNYVMSSLTISYNIYITYITFKSIQPEI